MENMLHQLKEKGQRMSKLVEELLKLPERVQLFEEGMEIIAGI